MFDRIVRNTLCASILLAAGAASGEAVNWNTTGYADRAHMSTALRDARNAAAVHTFAADATGEWILSTSDGVESSANAPYWPTYWAERYHASGRAVDTIAFPPAGGWVVVAEDWLRYSNDPWPHKNLLVSEIRRFQSQGDTIDDLAFDADGSGWALTAGGETMCVDMDSDGCRAVDDAVRAGRPVRQFHITPNGNWIVAARDWFAGEGVSDTLRHYLGGHQRIGRMVHRIHMNDQGGYVRTSRSLAVPRPEDVLDAVEQAVETADGRGGRERVGIWEAMDRLNSVAVTMAYQAGPGQPIVTRGYGTLEVGTERWVSTESRFSVQSISKMATAIITMFLDSWDWLDVDDPVFDRANDVARGAALDHWLTIARMAGLGHLSGDLTLVELMSHTAGFPNHDEDRGGSALSYFEVDVQPNTAELLAGADCNPWTCQTAWARILWPVYGVGTDYEYSNAGFVVLQAVLERVSGLSLPELGALIFDRLGLERTTFGRVAALEHDTVAAHLRDGALAPSAATYPKFAAAGMYTTSADLVRLGRFVLEGGRDQWGVRQVDAALFDRMRQNHIPAGQPCGSTNPYRRWCGNDGYGWGLWLYEGTGPDAVVIGHGGNAYDSRAMALLKMNTETGEVFAFAIAGGDTDANNQTLRTALDRAFTSTRSW